MPQKKSILKKFYSKLTKEEKPLLEDYIDNSGPEALSETFDKLVENNKYEDKNAKS